MVSAIKKVNYVTPYLLENCFYIVDQTRSAEAINLYKTLREDVELKKHIMFVFDGVNAPLGFIKGQPFSKVFDKQTGLYSLQAKIDYLFVDKNFQRSGIGALLLKTYESYCIENGVNRIYLHSTPTKQALNFYMKNGYVNTGIKNVMRKNLGGKTK